MTDPFKYICFSIRKNFLKRKLVERLPLIYKSLQEVQLPRETFVFPEKFAEFYYQKIFETRSR